MKTLKVCTLAFASLLAVAASAKTVTMSRATLQDKIKGGWAGQTIGCAFGGPTEFKNNGKIIPDETKIVWDDTRVKHYFDTFPGLYDDIYMDLTFVEVFEKKGLDAPISEFAHYAGLMAPGMPQAAAHYSDAIGHMMCYGDGWYGGVYVATMYSLAFLSNDVNYIVTEALKSIPEQSTFYQCQADVIAGFKAGKDWKTLWHEMQKKWGTTDLCPDGVKAAFNIDAKINCAYVIMGLLYGGGDYTKTMEVSTRCGQDSDCNPSTAGGILGTMLGYSNIPDYWKNSLKSVEDIPFIYTNISLNKVYELGMKHALQVIAKNGGKVTAKAVKIKTQPIKTVRLEQSFEGMEFVRKIGLGNKGIDKVGAIKFNGCGIVIRGHLRTKDPNYVGEVEITIDGKKMPIVKLPGNNHARSNDLYWNFDLEDGDHVLTMKRLNPEDNVESNVYSYLTFKKKAK